MHNKVATIFFFFFGGGGVIYIKVFLSGNIFSATPLLLKLRCEGARLHAFGLSCLLVCAHCESEDMKWEEKPIPPSSPALALPFINLVHSFVLLSILLKSDKSPLQHIRRFSTSLRSENGIKRSTLF